MSSSQGCESKANDAKSFHASLASDRVVMSIFARIALTKTTRNWKFFSPVISFGYFGSQKTDGILDFFMIPQRGKENLKETIAIN